MKRLLYLKGDIPEIKYKTEASIATKLQDKFSTHELDGYSCQFPSVISSTLYSNNQSLAWTVMHSLLSFLQPCVITVCNCMCIVNPLSRFSFLLKSKLSLHYLKITSHLHTVSICN